MVAAPACLSGVVAVGATYEGNVGRQPPSGDYSALSSEFPACFNATTGLDTITCFTNSSSRVDILAPGAPITSRALGGGTVSFYGTSQASPTAAGISALMLEANPNLSPGQIAGRLKLSGSNVTDPKNGLSFPRIDALNAVQLSASPARTAPRSPRDRP
jgi:subtilisin family serine protease